jgi:hypothetical protein
VRNLCVVLDLFECIKSSLFLPNLITRFSFGTMFVTKLERLGTIMEEYHQATVHDQQSPARHSET